MAKNLADAKRNKNDEFYTRYEDVENECRNYKSQFKNKIIYCNCDDPVSSNFFKYFALNFKVLGLKKLICTCYCPNIETMEKESLWGKLEESIQKVNGNPETKRAYKVIIPDIFDVNNDDMINLDDIYLMVKNDIENEEFKYVQFLDGDGDFRSKECIDLLDECDIVVTNPPFSIFREYVALLEEHNKKYLIIGNKNAITYKEIFPLIKNNKMWLGYGEPSNFITPNKGSKNVNGLCRWFTNLDTRKRHEELYLYKTYYGNEKDYPKYDNYDAINVDRVEEIPCNYNGVMGVPITFLDKYCPEQFDIIGLGIANLGLSIGVRPYLPEHKSYRKNIQNKGAVDGDLYMVDKNNRPVVPYARILIRVRADEREERCESRL